MNLQKMNYRKMTTATKTRTYTKLGLVLLRLKVITYYSSLFNVIPTMHFDL